MRNAQTEIIFLPPPPRLDFFTDQELDQLLSGENDIEIDDFLDHLQINWQYAEPVSDQTKAEKFADFKDKLKKAMKKEPAFARALFYYITG